MALPEFPPRPLLLKRDVFARDRLVAAFLGLIALGLAFLMAHDIFLPPPAQVNTVRTAAVSMGTVRSAVTGTGTLVPAAQQNLGFRTPGQLTEVDAKVGDHVAAGQVLARIDPTSAELALQQAQASLAAAQANLANTLNGTALVQSQHALAQSRQSYSDTVNQVNLTNSNDQATVNADQAQVNADQAQSNADQANYWYTQYQPTLQAFQGRLNAAQAEYRSLNCDALTSYPPPNPPPPTPPPSCGAAQADILAAQNGINCIQGGGAACSPQQMEIAAAYKAVAADNSRTAADNSKLAADNFKYSTDQAAGQRSITQASYSVTNAQDAYNSQASNRSATIDQQYAAVAGAQAAVGTAQQNLDATTLTAPMAGVITGVTGQVGDYVAASSPSSGGQAPGSTAPLPAATTASGSSSSGGSAFMVLMNDKAYQAVVSFAESDAAKVQALQTGSLSFDALPNLTIPAHVLAVAPAATISSNVVNYYVTLTLDSLDNRLKSGLTANASVTTANAANVVVVPNSAVTRLGGGSFVNVLRAGKEVRTRIQTGIVGDTSTEVTAGLQVGDKVVLPQLRVPAGTNPRGGAGGGGAIRLGGGGGGGG